MAQDLESSSFASRYHYMINLLETLRAFGGECSSQEVYSWFKAQVIARPSDLADLQKSGETRFAKEVRFARQLLFYGGLVSDGPGGRWKLTPDGWNTSLDLDGARALARRSNWKVRPGGKPSQRESVATGITSRDGPTTGPVPQAWCGTVTRNVDRPTSTYAMRFGESSVWKIGHAANITSRLADINRHVPTEVVAAKWNLMLERRWPRAEVAYAMEQRVLGELRHLRTTGERVDCPEELLLAVWSRSS